ncbi:MAG: hypothetical protein LUH11_04400 [Candidatus Gastranaerophilales bacterium]|nr:hypothetical protein [Candidatus Gastranaerophilales bacterium]
MKKEIISLSIISLMTLSPCLCLAKSNYSVVEPVVQTTPANSQLQYPMPVNSYQTQDYNYEQLQGNVVMVPSGTSFTGTATSALSSETSKAGDSVSFYLASDFYYGSSLIAGAGSRINGTVITAKKGGYASKNGQLQVKFTNIVTPSGQMIPISASIQTSDGTGILKAGTAKDVTKDYAKDLAVGAAAGAALGTAMGALSSGSVGKGAIYGTAVGGGLGLGKSLIDKGDNVEIPANAQLTIVLDQPVTVSSNTTY